jgi:hypothetical protein
MPRPSHPPYFDHPNNTGRKATEFIIIIISSSSSSGISVAVVIALVYNKSPFSVLYLLSLLTSIERLKPHSLFCLHEDSAFISRDVFQLINVSLNDREKIAAGRTETRSLHFSGFVEQGRRVAYYYRMLLDFN